MNFENTRVHPTKAFSIARQKKSAKNSVNLLFTAKFSRKNQKRPPLNILSLMGGADLCLSLLISGCPMICSTTDPECVIPGPSHERTSVRGNSQTRDTVVMSEQNGDARRLQRVPHIHSVIVVTSKDDTPTERKVQTSCREDDAIFGETIHFTIRPQVKQSVITTQNRDNQFIR